MKEKSVIKGWVNIYPFGHQAVYYTKSLADYHAHPNRIACVPIEQEVEYEVADNTTYNDAVLEPCIMSIEQEILKRFLDLLIEVRDDLSETDLSLYDEDLRISIDDVLDKISKVIA